MDFKRTRVKVGLLDFEYSASLIVLDRQLDPDVITQALRLAPRRCHRRGDARQTPAGTPLTGVYESGCWSVDLETRDGEDVSEFLSRLTEQLKPAKDFLRSIVDGGGEIECFVGLFATRLCDQVFPAELLTRLGQLGINLRLDYYDISAERNVDSNVTE